MWLSKYFVDFIIFSCMGWIYETIFCCLVKKRWENRGFLYGPLCPIYGFGAIACEILVDLLSSTQYAYHYTWWQVFIVCFFGSIVLEYTTAWALETLFDAYWWDYSKLPLNIKGRICFPCSVGFGLAGILVVYVLVPFMEHLTGWMSPIAAEFTALILMGILAMDTTLTVSALTQFAKSVAAIDEAVNVHMTDFVKNLQDGKYAPNVVFEEGRRAATAAIEAKRQSVSGSAAEEQERFLRERLEQAYASMSTGARSALKRVQGFRPHHAAALRSKFDSREWSRAERLNQLRGQLKERLHRKK